MIIVLLYFILFLCCYVVCIWVFVCFDIWVFGNCWVLWYLFVFVVVFLGGF